MFFSSTADTMRRFIFESIMNLVGVTDWNETTAGDAGHIIDAIDSSIQTRAMMQTRLKQK